MCLKICNVFFVSILASSSSGNSLFIETNKQKILVDAGLSGKKIIYLLDKINISPYEITSIFITHEHIDHIRGVGVLSRKYNINVYANKKTWFFIEKIIGKINKKNKKYIEIDEILILKDLKIKSFAVSHDAISPQFYRFYKKNKSFVVLTDIGYYNKYIEKNIKNADVYLLESNYDIEKLLNGLYSWRLKSRILSDYGHLSNEDSASLILKVVNNNKLKKIFLGHLSKENNFKKLVLNTMKKKFKFYNKINLINKCEILDENSKITKFKI